MAANGSNVDTVAIAKPVGTKVPEWVKAELFESVLRKDISGFKKIKDFKAFPAMAAGENYATLMLTIHIEAEVEDSKVQAASYMMKVPLDNELFKQMMAVNNIFDIEKIMYLDIVPEMEQMYEEAGVDVKFGAKCYRFEKNMDSDYILLEDLRPRGFKNTNRLEGQDMEHVKCVLKKMAQWHAASATRVANKGCYPTNVMNGIYMEQNRPILEEMLTGLAKPMLECMKLYKGYDVYGEAVESLQTKLPHLLLSLSKYDLNEFNVLNHGDCWSNNIMFQYDAFGKIRETFFIDFQVTKFGSPAQDLFYYIMSTPKLELKLKHFDYFIRYYHEHLEENLKLLKYPKKAPSLKELHAMLFKYGLWGYASTGAMALVLLDPSEKSSMDSILSRDEAGIDFKKQMYSNPRFRQHMEAIMPWLYNRGGLEYDS